MWKNTAEPQKSYITIWRVSISCWIPKATNTHSKYVILIAFPLRQWLHERASMYVSRALSVLLITTYINFSFKWLLNKVRRLAVPELLVAGLALNAM